jgi:hypothetical protein
MTWLEAAVRVLREEGRPMAGEELTRKILERGTLHTSASSSASVGPSGPPARQVTVPQVVAHPQILWRARFAFT